MTPAAPIDLKLLRLVPRTLRDKLELNYSVALPPWLRGPCVEYRGTRYSRNGYGRAYCTAARTERQAHIIVYELTVAPVPPGMLLDHLCRNRRCCAPWHLEAVTHRENTLRGQAVLFSKALTRSVSIVH